MSHYTQIHNLMHFLALEYAARSPALGLGQPHAWISRQEWQCHQMGNLSHYHILIKNNRSFDENLAKITADEKDFLSFLMETKDVNVL